MSKKCWIWFSNAKIRQLYVISKAKIFFSLFRFYYLHHRPQTPPQSTLWFLNTICHTNGDEFYIRWWRKSNTIYITSLLDDTFAVTSGCPGWTGRWVSSSPWRSLRTERSSSGRGTSSGKSWASCCPFSAPRGPPPGPCWWRKIGRRRWLLAPRTHSEPCLDPPTSQTESERAAPFYL